MEIISDYFCFSNVSPSPEGIRDQTQSVPPATSHLKVFPLASPERKISRQETFIPNLFFLLDEEIILFHLQVKAPLDQPEDLLLPETPGSGLVSRHDVVSQGRKPLRHIQDVVVAGVSCAMSGQAPEQDRLAALQL